MKRTKINYIESYARISDCKQYRYQLFRLWDTLKPLLGIVMHNSSTADGENDDPTIIRCVNRAYWAGYGGILVGNVFALRATNPQEVYEHPSPIGPDNPEYLLDLVIWCQHILCGWGDLPPEEYVNKILDKIGPAKLFHLGLTKKGQPRHPLYVSYNQKMIYWKEMEGK